MSDTAPDPWGDQEGSPLVLGVDDDGPRYFLDGKPVRYLDALELLLIRGTWLRVSVATNLRLGTRPHFSIGLGGYGQAMVVLPEGAQLRWPPDST